MILLWMPNLTDRENKLLFAYKPKKSLLKIAFFPFPPFFSRTEIE